MRLGARRVDYLFWSLVWIIQVGDEVVQYLPKVWYAHGGGDRQLERSQTSMAQAVSHVPGSNTKCSPTGMILREKCATIPTNEFAARSPWVCDFRVPVGGLTMWAAGKLNPARISTSQVTNVINVRRVQGQCRPSAHVVLAVKSFFWQTKWH